MTSPGKPNPSSSLPHQEKRWTEETVLNIRSNSGDISDQQAIADAHNASLGEPREKENLGEKEASSALTHVLQNALKEALPLLEIVRDYEPGEPDGACAPNRARALCAHIEVILSSPGVSSPVGGVASPETRRPHGGHDCIWSDCPIHNPLPLPPSLSHVQQMEREQWVGNDHPACWLEIRTVSGKWVGKAESKAERDNIIASHNNPIPSPQDGNSPATSVESPDTKRLDLLQTLQVEVRSANNLESAFLFWPDCGKNLRALIDEMASPVSPVERDGEEQDLGDTPNH